MIAVALILGAIIVGASVVSRYWDKIVDFMKKAIYRVQAKIDRVVQGCRVAIRRLGDRFQTLTKYYSKNEQGRWRETVVAKEMDKSEVPEKYRDFAALEDEFDLTPELELQLHSA